MLIVVKCKIICNARKGYIPTIVQILVEVIRFSIAQQTHMKYWNIYITWACRHVLYVKTDQLSKKQTIVWHTRCLIKDTVHQASCCVCTTRENQALSRIFEAASVNALNKIILRERTSFFNHIKLLLIQKNQFNFFKTVGWI